MQPKDAVFPLLLLAVVVGLVYAFGVPGLEAFRQPDDDESSRAVERGRVVYVARCASCHGRIAQGSASAPPLTGVADGPEGAGRGLRPPGHPMRPEGLTSEARAALSAYLGHIAGRPAPAP